MSVAPNESSDLLRPPMRILAVDDDEVDQLALQRGFRKAGVDVELVMARDGLEAFELLRSNTTEAAGLPAPCIVLLDLNMPRLGGLDFLDQLREDSALRSTIVFVVTTSDREADRMESYRRNVAGYVVKQRAGSGFSDLIGMLERYWKVVELPDA